MEEIIGYKLTISSQTYKWIFFPKYEFWTDEIVYKTYKEACEKLMNLVTTIVDPIYMMIDEIYDSGKRIRYYMDVPTFKRRKNEYRPELIDFIFHKENNWCLRKFHIDKND